MSSKGSAQLLVIIAAVIVLALVGGAYFLGSLDTKPSLVAQTPNPAVGNAAEVASLANAKCIQNGGFVTTAYKGNGGFYNICNFADDKQCELYALYEGQCPIGGISTIGYSTTPQVYCALRGGTLQGSENGQCKLPDGSLCYTDSVFNGYCQKVQ